MRMMLRYIGLLCLLNTIAICLSVAYGIANPAPLLNWNASNITLYDTHTGVDYAVPNPQIFSNTSSVSGVEIMSSADDAYTLTILSDPTGLRVILSNQADETLLVLNSYRDSRINNVGWIDARNFIVIRVQTESLSLSLLNVETLLERSLGTLANTAYSFSPNREWLLLIENDTNESTLTHFFDERHYTMNPISDIARWSSDGRYLASRARLGDNLGFQLLDTESGAIETSDFVPNRLSWSGDNRSLIIYDRHQMLFYQDSLLMSEYTFSETLLTISWSYDGQYAVLILQADEEKLLYVLNSQRDTLRLLASIADSVNERSIVWAYDSNTLNYILPNPNNAGQSSVFVIDIEQGTRHFLSYLPSTIARAYLVDSIDYFEDFP